MNTMTVLTIVSESLVQKILSANLQQASLLVICEENINDACNALQSIRPDLIILDASCAAAQASLIQHQLSRLASLHHIPIITLLDDDGLPTKNLPPEAKHTLRKPVTPSLLLDLVRSILQQGSAVNNQHCLHAGGITLNPLTQRVTCNDAEIVLRHKEFLLLTFLMKQVDRVFERNQLLDEVWGNDVYLEERTVDAAIRRLRVALEPYGLARRIETVRGSGYRFYAGEQQTTTKPRLRSSNSRIKPAVPVRHLMETRAD